jgi:hypothetical protein
MKKLKRLLLAPSIGMAFVIVCLMSIPVHAGTSYYYVPHAGNGLNWACGAYVQCWFTTPEDTIIYDGPVSQAYYDIVANFDVSYTVMGYIHDEATMGIRQQVEVDFTSWLDEWTVDAESWSYPQYDPEPTGGHYWET